MKAEINKTIRLVAEKKLVLLACCAAEILFFVFYGFFTAAIYQKLVQYANIIGSLASEAMVAAAREQKSLSSILLEPPVRPYFNDMLLLLLLLGITTYMLYCLIHAFIWSKALLIAGKKQGYIQYLKHFMKVNIAWFLLFVLYYFAGFAISIRNATLKVLADSSPSGMSRVLLIIFLVATAYFAIISYTGLGVRKSFNVGIRKFKQLVPSFVLFAAYLFAINFLLTQFSRLHYYAMIIFGLFTVIPFFTIARVYISLIVQKLK